jgi:DivIVA domain-containing protein
MEETPSAESLNSTTFREASFPVALGGYNRAAVRAFLDRVADWLDERGGGVVDPLTSEFAKVGERTSGILTAAEEAAARLRADAKDYAERLRADVEEEARMARLNASQKADEIVADAEAKAEQMIEDALARRRRLNQAVSSLAERRDEITGQVAQLADELFAAVEAIRSSEQSVEGAEPLAVEAQAAPPVEDNGSPPAGPDELPAGEPTADEPTQLEEPTALEAPDERETAIHETR